MKNKSKNNKLIITLMVIVVLLVSITIFILNYSFNNTSLTILENKWISENTSNMLDVSTYNNIPIFGENGEGIIFDFLDSFSSEHGITFNKISYYTNADTTYKDIAFKVIQGSVKLEDNEILMYTDYYSLLSLEYQNYSDLTEITNLKIGVLKDDLDRTKYYLDSSNTFTDYTDIDTMLKELKDKKIDYIVLPTNQYIESIISSDLFVDYKFLSFNNNYVLSIKDDTLFSIFSKFYSNYMTDEYSSDYSKEFLNVYFETLDIEDVNKVNYNSKTYRVGYVTELPFIGYENSKQIGIIADYLNDFEEVANVEFEYQTYSKVSDLTSSINNNGGIDLSFVTYDTTSLNENRETVNIPVNRKYVILSKDYFNVDSIQGLSSYDNIYTIENSYLYTLAMNLGIETKAYSDSNELLRNIDDESIILIDNVTYEYYKNKKLNSYNVVYRGTLTDKYSFTLDSDSSNEVFNGLFKTYVSLADFNSLEETYLNNSTDITLEQVKNVSKYLLILFSVIFAFLLICLILINKKKKEKLVNKNDKLKYIDQMTSLKNRNYLNHNIKKWSSSHHYPQAVIIIDLNNIKYINDNYGHEEGDNVIKKAANTLIVNQLENSDIMRTDGNEFLIYLLGYDEKQIISYCHKLFKELKELPHNFGATLGHSMIEDDVKTLEDAINEATIEMRQAKEKMK
jgi:diguanylate cyclase (GGDEF)-like protein